MLSGEKISVKSIIAKVYRDLHITDEIEFDDVIEWAAEALDAIHVYPQYDHLEYRISIEDYRGEMPLGFISLEAISYNGGQMLPTNQSGSFTNEANAISWQPYSYNQEKIANVTLVGGGKYVLPNGDSFRIENGWFKSSFKEGFVVIVYTSSPMDEEGFPLIPAEFKEALYWYINYKITYIQARLGQVSSSFYSDAYDKWLYYCNQAGANALMPDLVQLEGLKRQWLTLLPNPHMYSNSFKDLGK